MAITVMFICVDIEGKAYVLDKWDSLTINNKPYSPLRAFGPE